MYPSYGEIGIIELEQNLHSNLLFFIMRPRSQPNLCYTFVCAIYVFVKISSDILRKYSAIDSRRLDIWAVINDKSYVPIHKVYTDILSQNKITVIFWFVIVKCCRFPLYIRSCLSYYLPHYRSISRSICNRKTLVLGHFF